MRHIQLVSNAYKDPDLRITRHLAAALEQRDCQVSIEAAASPQTGCLPGCDLLVSLGGDGTFLNAAHRAYACDIPVLGINLGSLGFLAEVDRDEIDDAVERIAAGDYMLDERLMLEVDCRDEAGRQKLHGYALNEALLTRAGNPRIVPIELWINDTYIELIAADGLMVSTPTGSTGYAMACGGPILDPRLNILQITPVAPHSLHDRSYIVPDTDRLTFRMRLYPEPALLTIDSREETPFRDSDEVHISKAERPLKVAQLVEHNFFQELPEKLRGRAVPRNHKSEVKGESL